MVDADDFNEAVKPVAPKAKVSKGKKLVALLEYPHEDEHWYTFKAGHDVENFGILDDRDDMDRLLEILNQESLQVYLGIKATTLPDRGVMRKLDKIAQHAKEGLVVQLLTDEVDEVDEVSDNSHNENVRFEQWQTALAERQIGLVQ